MSLFGFGKRKEEIDREKKIKEFRQAFPNTRKPYNDDSAFELLFQVDHQFTTLRIFLTSDFPNSKPGSY